ncbi:ABC1 kinase family protein [Microseira sp. BLCC-F43]|uniref:ABC1 kinase family protein n=1 Tax=Microseira sp. BLCC-F43 TaxID=3153602 RepID=UPI0035B76D4E
MQKSRDLPRYAKILGNSSKPLADNAVAAMVDYSQQPRKLWARRLTILNSFLSWCSLLVWDGLRGDRAQNQARRASALRQKLIQLGPTFIKLGQMLSCRPDLIPPVYLEELANLQDQLPPFSNQEAYQLIEEELGGRYDEIYAELTPEPVAAASLGQVYKGKLKTGEIVAVKVQRPGLLDRIALDIYLVRQLAAWAQKNIPFIHSDLVALTDELATRLFEEMDYIQEGRNAEKFAQLYGDLNHIYVPRIYFEYTSRRVLTMEWINGIKLTSTEAIRAQGLDPTDLVAFGFKCSLKQLLEGGFFHADPHPGNALVTPDGKLAYLDFGMMSEVSPETSDRLIVSLLHLIAGDFEGLAQDYILLGFLPPQTDITPLIPKLAEVFGNIREASVAEFGFKQSFERLSGLMYEYPFQAPTYYLMIFRCFATLEGIALKVNPNFPTFKLGYPYIAKWMLTKGTPTLRNSLTNFLFKNRTIQWQQVSDLLENARSSDDCDLNQILVGSLEFLYSPQGEYLRHALVDEIVTDLELLLQKTFGKVMTWVGLTVTHLPLSTRESLSLDKLQRLVDIMQQTPAFELSSFSEILPLLFKEETQRLGQEIASELGQRLWERLMSDPRSIFNLKGIFS